MRTPFYCIQRAAGQRTLGIAGAHLESALNVVPAAVSLVKYRLRVTEATIGSQRLVRLL